MQASTMLEPLPARSTRYKSSPSLPISSSLSISLTPSTTPSHPDSIVPSHTSRSFGIPAHSLPTTMRFTNFLLALPFVASTFAAPVVLPAVEVHSPAFDLVEKSTVPAKLDVLSVVAELQASIVSLFWPYRAPRLRPLIPMAGRHRHHRQDLRRGRCRALLASCHHRVRHLR